MIFSKYPHILFQLPTALSRLCRRCYLPYDKLIALKKNFLKILAPHSSIIFSFSISRSSFKKRKKLISRNKKKSKCYFGIGVLFMYFFCCLFHPSLTKKMFWFFSVFFLRLFGDREIFVSDSL